jgi:hypothetical protein
LCREKLKESRRRRSLSWNLNSLIISLARPSESVRTLLGGTSIIPGTLFILTVSWVGGRSARGKKAAKKEKESTKERLNGERGAREIKSLPFLPFSSLT